jgi:O-antigen/teichoic acid export membrane protein
MNRIGRFSVIKVVANVVALVLLAVFVWKQPSITTAVYSWIGGEVVSTLVALWFVIPIASPGLVISRSLLKESLKFGSAVCVGSLIGMASLRLDLFLVAYFLDTSEVGLYSVATVVSSVIMYLPSAMAVALLPRFSSAGADESYELAARGCRFAVIWGVGCAVFLGLLGGVLISAVYGGQFRASATAMRILLPGTVIYGLAHITTAYYNGFVGRPVINTALAAVSLAIGIALDLALIPRFGITGAAVAASVAYAASMVVGLFVFWRVSGRSALPLLAVGKRDFLEFRDFVSRNLRDLLQKDA